MIEENPNAITTNRIWRRENIITTVLAVFIAISLLIHVITLLALQRVRHIVQLQLSTAAAQVAEARNQPIKYNFPIKQDFPFSTTIALSETLDVPIQESFPIKQTFNVPIDTSQIFPGGPVLQLPVPIDLTVPVSTTVKVVVRKQIPINTTINIDTNIPLQIDLKDPPMGDLLKRIEDTLRDLYNQL